MGASQAIGRRTDFETEVRCWMHDERGPLAAAWGNYPSGGLGLIVVGARAAARQAVCELARGLEQLGAAAKNMMVGEQIPPFSFWREAECRDNRCELNPPSYSCIYSQDRSRCELRSSPCRVIRILPTTVNLGCNCRHGTRAGGDIRVHHQGGH